ncbi:MAG: anion permease [Holosporales bacterium]|nr:anion permease [Holosporales bacterium]
MISIHKDIKIVPLLLIVLCAAVIWFIVPSPTGLSVKAWHMLIIFAASMIGIMMDIIPLCGTLFLSLLFSALTGTIDIKTQGVSGFAAFVPWLIFFVVAMSKAITNSTISVRIAYFFIKTFGKNIIGLSYSLTLAELVLATILPSNTARGASIGLPLTTSLAKYIGSSVKGASEKDVGSFLSFVYVCSNSVCSAMFLTAMISNAIIADTAAKSGLSLNWISWLGYTCVPCLIILAIVPIVLYFLSPPRVMSMGMVQEAIRQKEKDLGPLSTNEKYVLCVFGGMLLMWILADVIRIDIMTTTIMGLCIFLLLGIFKVKDVLGDSAILNPVITIGILISYANCLSEFGVIDWFNNEIKGVVELCPDYLKLHALSIVYFLTHYFFSGEGSRIIALNLPFVLTGLSLGIDKTSLITTLAVFSSFSDMLAHYTCPASILLFSNGYMTAGKRMGIGIVISAIMITLWFMLGT